MASVTVQDLGPRFRAYLSGAVLYGLAIGIYSIFPYYRGLISRSDLNISYLSDFWRQILEPVLTVTGANTYSLIIHLYLGYLVFGLLWFWFYPRARNNTRTLIFWRVVSRFGRRWREFFTRQGTAGLPDLQLTKEEKSTVLFFLVKFFFTPIMINFFFANVGAFGGSAYNLITAAPADQLAYTRLVYFTFLNFMLIVDTVFFVIGYLFEFAAWGNELRSTEPTFFGWAVALACYPPFNSVVSQIIGWGSSDYSNFSSPTATIVAAYVSLVLFFIYTWATVALGLKASNLTNRGIVTTGPYAYVRHPAYISKNLHWLIMGLPLIANNWLAGVSIFLWAGIYGLRALTEERHLLADPDYQAYVKKVPNRFLPGII